MKASKFKGIIAVLLLIAVLIPQCKVSQVTATSTTKKEEILTLTKVCTDSSILKGNKKVTRQMFAKYLVQATDSVTGKRQATKQQLFSDVKRNSSYSAYINLAVMNGYMSGYTNGKFKPNQQITLKEAITGVLSVLGYTKEDFMNGASDARYIKYKELKLNTGITKTEQDKLTTKDLRNLLYNLLNAKNKVGSTYATTLGYEINNKGEIDYDKLLAKKTKGPVIATTGWEKKLPYSITKFKVFVNGKQSNTYRLNDHSIVYYCKDLKKLWIYNKNVCGVYSTAAPNAIEPQTITVSGQNYTVGKAKTIAKKIADYEIVEGKPVVLLFGKDNKVENIIPLKAKIADTSWKNTIKDVDKYSIYLNGIEANANEIKENDAIYYSTEIRTIWAFNKKINGTIDKVLPSIENPELIEIGGKTYTLSKNPINAEKSNTFTSNPWGKILQQRSIKEGTEVVLVYGYDGDVVGIVPVEAMKLTYDGYVLDIGSKVVKDKNGSIDVHKVMKLVDSCGIEREFQVSGNIVQKGDVVRVGFEYGESVVTKLTQDKFDYSNAAIINKKFAPNIHVIDVNKSNYQSITPDQLGSTKLDSSNVLYFQTNSLGEITDLIVKNVTGIGHLYGIVKDIIAPYGVGTDETYTNYSDNTVVSYDINGSSNKLPVADSNVNYNPGPMSFEIEDNMIIKMEPLKAIRLGYIQGMQANDGKSIYKIANNATTYLLKESKYYAVKLEDVSNLSDYQVLGYIDNSQAQGGVIRILVATKK